MGSMYYVCITLLVVNVAIVPPEIDVYTQNVPFWVLKTARLILRRMMATVGVSVGVQMGPVGSRGYPQGSKSGHFEPILDPTHNPYTRARV